MRCVQCEALPVKHVSSCSSGRQQKSEQVCAPPSTMAEDPVTERLVEAMVSAIEMLWDPYKELFPASPADEQVPEHAKYCYVR